jgi:hypothetical protein
MRYVVAFLALSLFAQTSSMAQSQPTIQFTESPVKCVRLGGMVTLFEWVVNEQQVMPPMSTDIFRGNGDCTYNDRPYTADRQAAMRAGVSGAQSLGGFFGWIVTDRWLIAVEEVGMLDRAMEKMYRPGAILDRGRWTLLRRCARLTQTISGVQIVGHQLDWRGRAWGCHQPVLTAN